MLIETIRIYNGAIWHLSLHQERLNRSQAALFGDYEPIDLGRVIHPPTGSGTLKCRVLYGERLVDVTYKPYRPRTIRRLKALEAALDYAHKFSDREALNELFAARGDADDILIVRDGLVTDTSIANIAFRKGRTWYTPRTPLLKGTTRERLLRSGFLVPRDIPFDEVGTFDAFALMNAMIGFEPVKDGKIV
ncbi:aminotransferase class IV family protein [Hydrogenimonas sp.]